MAFAEFLSGFATRGARADMQGERMRAAAERFAGLISSPAVLGAAARAQSRATLFVQSGLHHRASIELTADEYLLGSGDDCDIILRDACIAPQHCRLTRARSGFSLRDARATASQPIRLQGTRRTAETLESAYDIGGVVVAVLEQVSASSTAGRVERPRTLRLFSCALLVGLLLTAIAFLAARRLVEPQLPDVAGRIARGAAALAAQGFPAVRFRSGPRGELEIGGLVADAPEQERLRGWLARTEYRDAHFKVQSAAGLIDQVRHALAAADLQIGFDNGRLRIEGTTRALPIKRRIRMIADELQGVVEIDDRVAYVDMRERPPKPGPLPVRIRDVMIGNPSYFRTDTGAQYYEGAVLPDGAVVLAIEASQIHFRLGDKVVVYNLD